MFFARECQLKRELYRHSQIYTINQLNYHLATLMHYRKGCGLKANMALGFTLCYISLLNTPSCYISHIAPTGLVCVCALKGFDFSYELTMDS